MPFVQGKCESCGGILAVDPSLKAANCPFCGVAYVVQDSINYYNTTIKVETMHADIVNVSDESTSEGRIRAADALMKLGKYEKAEADYKKATELTPQNYRGWLGLIESHTRNYTLRIKSGKEINLLEDYAKSVRTFAPEESRTTLLQQYESYKGAEIEKNRSEIAAFSNAISQQTVAWNQILEQEGICKETFNKNQMVLDNLNSFIRKYETQNYNMTKVIWIIVLLVLGVLGLFAYVIPGILHLLAAGIPTYLLVSGVVQYKNSKKQRTTLISTQQNLQVQISELEKQRKAFYTAILSNKNILKDYE